LRQSKRLGADELRRESRKVKKRTWRYKRGFVEQRTQVGVECPQCHWRQFMEIEVDSQLLKSPLALEIRHHLEEWVKSRCPDHLGALLEFSKN
jgi:hypothetical protein